METTENPKEIILKQILNNIDVKIATLKRTIQDAKDSRDNETKSSVGDKYETGRTTMQLELEKNRVQLNKTERQKIKLLKIDLRKKSNKVEYGSLVTTNNGTYFISVACGKIETERGNCYCLSLASPFGKALLDKKPGDTIYFQNRKIQVISIL